MEEKYMTIKQAAEALKVSRRHIQRLIDRGQLHSTRNPLYLKGPVYILRSEVEALKQLSQPEK